MRVYIFNVWIWNLSKVTDKQTKHHQSVLPFKLKDQSIATSERGIYQNDYFPLFVSIHGRNLVKLHFVAVTNEFGSSHEDSSVSWKRTHLRHSLQLINHNDLGTLSGFCGIKEDCLITSDIDIQDIRIYFTIRIYINNVLLKSKQLNRSDCHVSVLCIEASENLFSNGWVGWPEWLYIDYTLFRNKIFLKMNLFKSDQLHTNFLRKSFCYSNRIEI